jgi:hypothetical protein
MSDVVGRTLAALPKLFGDNLIGNTQIASNYIISIILRCFMNN